ncbi:MAG TPA: DUF6526 family protein [Bryobacteraceae bacterium]|nr:DUF6526 family protein [Bryobacteraceae bacterium]
MPEKTPQNYANHAKLDPAFHLFLLPVSGINVLIAIWYAVRHLSVWSIWMVVLSVAGVFLVLKCRLYALKVQDRVIRLEERLRLSGLLAEPLRSRIGELSESQLIALRFASDEEVAKLVDKALASNLPNTEIKKAVVNWKPDYFRV